MKVSETANCVLSLIVTRFADVVGIVLHGLVRPAQYVEEILRFYCKWGKGRSEYIVLNYCLIQLIVFLKLNSQTQLSNSVLKFSSQIQFSNSVLKFSSQIQLPFGAPPPAPCKERFLLTILSSRRIRLHPANGSHYAARKTIRPGATSLSIHIFCTAPGQGFALKAAESLGCLAPHARR
jgi:hypothetical protein